MNIKGIAASNGIAIASVFKLENTKLVIKNDKILDSEQELNEFLNVLDISEQELLELRDLTAKNIDEEHAQIFDAHLQILKDPAVLPEVTSLIVNEKYNASYAYNTVCETFATIFENMDNDYMKERASDVRDVARRVIAKLQGVIINDPTQIASEVIVIAEDLTPSDTAQLNKQFVKGFATNVGGRTSHSAIMARSLEIPAVVGTFDILSTVQDGDILIIDGYEGTVIINPTKEEIAFYNTKKNEKKKLKRLYKSLVSKASISLDGHHVELAANIGSPEDVKSVIENGAEGIGLYRTEFLYMNNDDFPTEDEQYIAYKMVLESMGNKKVVIRTLDIGGDKELPYLDLPKEMNPFLGHRALRLCLDKVDLFKTQLKALLRASKHGNLHIMFPMVATINELRRAKAVLKECEQELGGSYKYKLGIMVEIPAVAILADLFAKEVDFFSIGTNDLIQYTFAADRMNQNVSYLYQPYNPSLLRLIKMVIDASHKEGIWTGMCGEMAGDQIAAPLLLGLGLDEFSMSASSILETRYLFSKLDKNEMAKLANQALNKSTNEEVYELVNQYLKK